MASLPVVEPRRSDREIQGRRLLECVYVRLTLAPELRGELLQEAEGEPALTGEAKERLAEMLDLIGEDLARNELIEAMKELGVEAPEESEFDGIAMGLGLK